MKFSQLKDLYVEMRVPEGDIDLVAHSRRAEAAFASRPEDTFPVTVVRVEPMASVDPDGNAFTLRGRLDATAPWFRPGMSGIAKVDAGVGGACGGSRPTGWSTSCASSCGGDPAMNQDRALFSESWHRVAAQRLRLRPSVRIRRQAFRGDIWYVAQDEFTNQFYRFRPEAYAFIARLDGTRTIEQRGCSAWTATRTGRPGRGRSSRCSRSCTRRT